MPAPKLYTVTPEAVASRLNILIYGPAGVGKTSFAAESMDHPKMRQTLFLNIEGGLASVAYRGTVQAVDITNTTELEEAFWAVARGDYPGVQTVVVDSISELQVVSLEEITAQAVKDKPRRTNPDDIYQDDYGISTVRVRRLLRWFRDLPINVIFTSLPKSVYPRGQENAEPIEVTPALTARLADSVMGYMDAVWYMFTREESTDPDSEDSDKRLTRFLLTQNRGIYRAKTRGAKFAEAMGQVHRLDDNEPNMPRIYDLFIKTEGATPAKKEKANATT